MNAAEFLKKYNIDVSSFSMDELVDGFAGEMTKGLETGSSLRMILSYIKLGSIRKNEEVCVIDAGGTNLRIGRAVITDNGFETVKETFKTRMLGTQGPLNGEEFFDRLSDMCLPFVGSGDTISFCFSFPAVITPDLDAEIIMFDKEVEIFGLEGKLVGRGLREALESKGVTDVKVIVINDTVATCLAGMAERQSGYDAYTGTILGTGFNACYFEDMKNIRKTDDNEGYMIINMEAGGYDGFPRNEIDSEYDSTLMFPGHQQAEQLISGGYFGHIVAKTLVRAASEGVIVIKDDFDAETADVDAFLRNRGGHIAEMVDSESMDAALEITRALVTRASMFAAAVHGAEVKKTGAAKTLITVEGSTYYRLSDYKKQIDGFFRDYLERHVIEADMIEVENAVLKGCAIAALINN